MLKEYIQKILINVQPFETRAAIVENNASQEIFIERTKDKSRVGNIYLGKVIRVLPGIQSAFIDIGLEQAAFIHINDLKETRDYKEKNQQVPIEKILFLGQTILVRVIKDAIKTKGPRLNNQINIAGRYLILLPQENKIRISSKISNPVKREQLKLQLTELLNDIKEMGFIIRSNAENAPLEELKMDIEYLKQQWSDIQKKIQTSSVPSLVYSELSLSQKVLRDICSQATESIMIDDVDTLKELQTWSSNYIPLLSHKLKLYEHNTPIFELYQIEKEIQNILQKRIELKSGGYLIIEQTEALVSIDVNSGRFVGGKNFQDSIFKINLEAAVEIVRQLRMRNLGGIIIIDFIDMVKDIHQKKVLETLEHHLKRDRNRTQIHPFSPLGLVQMTRKRATSSLPQQLAQECPSCHGNAVILNKKTVCYNLFREIQREALQFNPKEFRIITSSDLIELLLDEENDYFLQLTENVQKKIILQADDSYQNNEYDLILN